MINEAFIFLIAIYIKAVVAKTSFLTLFQNIYLYYVIFYGGIIFYLFYVLGFFWSFSDIIVLTLVADISILITSMKN